MSDSYYFTARDYFFDPIKPIWNAGACIKRRQWNACSWESLLCKFHLCVTILVGNKVKFSWFLYVLFTRCDTMCCTISSFFAVSKLILIINGRIASLLERSAISVQSWACLKVKALSYCPDVERLKRQPWCGLATILPFWLFFMTRHNKWHALTSR